MSREWLRIWIPRALAVGLVVFLSLELGLRARIYFRQEHRFDADGLFRYKAQSRVGPTPAYETNAHGFFGPPLTSPKPADEYRVFVLGSSAIASPRLAPAIAAALGAQDFPGTPSVCIAGIPRYTSYHNLKVLKQYLLPLEPDCIVIYLGMNDNVYNTFPFLEGKPFDGFYDVRDFRRSVLLDTLWYQAVTKRFRVDRNFQTVRSDAIFSDNLREMLSIAANHGICALLVPLTASYPTDDEELAGRIAASEGAMSHFWGTLESGLRGLRAHQAAMRQIAEDTGVPLIDLSSALPRDGAHFQDLCHFTEQGIDVLGQALGEAILTHCVDSSLAGGAQN